MLVVNLLFCSLCLLLVECHCLNMELKLYGNGSLVWILRPLNSPKKKFIGYLSKQHFIWKNFNSFLLYRYLVHRIMSYYLVSSMKRTFSLPYECGRCLGNRLKFSRSDTDYFLGSLMLLF